ncbi:MAG: PAS domain S-box protein [Candidatus Thorarchaeota archaeon]
MPRILLIDDDKDLLILAKAQLQRIEPTLRVVTTQSPQEALRLLEKGHFDAVVSDYQMHDINGLKLLAKLRNKGNSIPFIMFTGRGHEEVAMQALNLGADYYLMKGGDVTSQYGELAHIINQQVMHRQTEQALQEALIQAQNYLDIASVILVAIDANETVSMINQKGCKVLGYPEEEIVGKNWFDTFLPERLRDEVRAFFAKLMAGDIQLVEYFENPIMTRSDEERIIGWHNTLLKKNSQIIGTLSSGEDITERKHAEQKLTESEEKYRDLIKNMNDVIYILDNKGDTTYCSPSIETMLGYTPSEIIESPIANFLHPEDKQRALGGMQAALSGNSAQDEYRLISKSGDVHWVHSSSRLIMSEDRVIGLQGTLRDITDRKKMEEELQESEERYRELIEKMHEGLLVDDAEGTITFANPRASELLGYSEEELIGQNALLLLSPDKEKGKVREESAKRPHGISSTYETDLRTKNGKTLPVRITASPLFSANGRFKGTIGIFTDITEWKQAENALRGSEKRYRHLFEDSPISLWETDYSAVKQYIDNLRNSGITDFREYFKKYPREVAKCANLPKIVAVNSSTQRLYKAESHEDFLERLTEIFSIKTLPMFKEGFIALAEGALVFEGEGITHTLDSSELLIKIKASVAPGCEETLPRVIFAVIDITEQRKTENALRESEQKYRELVEELHEGVLVEHNDNISFVNPRAAALLGYSEEELIGQHWKIIVAPECIEAVKEENEKRVQGISSTYEINLQKKNGETIPVITSGTPLFNSSGAFRGTLAVFTDISKLKAAEQALRESELKYRAILEKMNDGYYESDLRGNYSFFNDAMCDLLGYTAQELLGMNYQEIMDKETAKACYQVYNALYRTKEPTKPIIGPIMRKDGTKRFVETTPSLIIDESGKAVGFRGLLHDTTERKHAEVRLGRQKEELSEFAHTMAHDLKNSLLSIEGYAELLETEYDPVYAKKISAIAVQMNTLLRRSVILADAGQIIEKSDEIDLSDLVQKTARAVIPENIVFTSNSLPIVVGDREKLAQVFQNLFENAVIHGQPNSIRVRYQRTREGGEILITNDGMPIPKENQEKIFSRGFTTKTGRGLGLTIVQKVIEAHGWQIRLYKAPQTTFRIVLPADK